MQLIYDVLVSGVQQTESVIHRHISNLFQVIFLYRPLQSIEQSSLCYTVGPYQVICFLYTAVCICQFQFPNLSLPPTFFWVTVRLFSTSVTLCFVNKFICIIFLYSIYKQYYIFVFPFFFCINETLTGSLVAFCNLVKMFTLYIFSVIKSFHGVL